MTDRQALVHCSQSSKMPLSRWIRSILGDSWQLANLSTMMRLVDKSQKEWPSKVYAKSHWLNGFHHQHSLGSLLVTLHTEPEPAWKMRDVYTTHTSLITTLQEWLLAIGAPWSSWNCCETCQVFCFLHRSSRLIIQQANVVVDNYMLPGGIGTSTYTFH